MPGGTPTKEQLTERLKQALNDAKHSSNDKNHVQQCIDALASGRITVT
jgi:hypothetical protein